MSVFRVDTWFWFSLSLFLSPHYWTDLDLGRLVFTHCSEGVSFLPRCCSEVEDVVTAGLTPHHRHATVRSFKDYSCIVWGLVRRVCARSPPPRRLRLWASSGHSHSPPRGPQGRFTQSGATRRPWPRSRFWMEPAPTTWRRCTMPGWRTPTASTR